MHRVSPVRGDCRGLSGPFFQGKLIVAMEFGKEQMEPIKACGVLLFRREPELSFLLMRHADRWDLPKGHLDPGESEVQCALRELEEESGIQAGDVRLDPGFRFTINYLVPGHAQPPGREASKQLRPKQLVVFLGQLLRPAPIRLSEHLGSEWFRWAPPHAIQPQTIDTLLASVAQFWDEQGPKES
jgi:bis(5'-nucleosidyl)-tetraphosphatase